MTDNLIVFDTEMLLIIALNFSAYGIMVCAIVVQNLSYRIKMTKGIFLIIVENCSTVIFNKNIKKTQKKLKRVLTKKIQSGIFIYEY